MVHSYNAVQGSLIQMRYQKLYIVGYFLHEIQRVRRICVCVCIMFMFEKKETYYSKDKPNTNGKCYLERVSDLGWGHRNRRVTFPGIPFTNILNLYYLYILHNQHIKLSFTELENYHFVTPLPMINWFR